MTVSASDTLVSVVIPAYNAQATIAETLRSVQAQTHDTLEIIVVNDGSTDATVAIAQDIAKRDLRITVLSQANGGVAAARNAGWKTARSDLVAFVDADDLWAPDKIARQLAVLTAGGDDIGLVYSWYAMIDHHGLVTDRYLQAAHEGRVLDILLTNNFVGNGSSALVRRSALMDVGGFEPNLRARGAQGCEDILFYCRIAERHGFAVVPDYLVGYRYTLGNMSSNLPKMLLSWLIVVEEFETRYPDKLAIIQQGLRHFGFWLVRRAVYLRQPGYVLPLVRAMARKNPAIACAMVLREIPGAAWKMASGPLRWRLAQRRHRNTNSVESSQLEAPDRFALGTSYLDASVQS